MNMKETFYRLVLTQLPGIGLMGAHNLIRAAGNATTLFERKKELKNLVPGISQRIIRAFDSPEVFRICEAEMNFADKNRIACLTAEDENFPSRLRECDDAPLVLFYRGTADLNKPHIISVVGTRNATEYGKLLCHTFIEELRDLLPDAIIVSGLAYGIDINAHRAALEYGLESIGVLAHGLDRIYPAVHRKTAIEMTECGGLLTEYMSGTNPDKANFVRRNRIVAGISDATIVVESAARGGSLITAGIAESYHRECFAFPGRIDDIYSKGCNNLIYENRAVLLQKAEDLIKAMGWDAKTAKPQAIQRQLFPDVSPEEEQIIAILGRYPEGQQINALVVDSNIPITRMTGILFELEMKGIVRMQAGGVYKLIG